MMPMDSLSMDEILEMIRDHRVSPEEGLQLYRSLCGSEMEDGAGLPSSPSAHNHSARHRGYPRAGHQNRLWDETRIWFGDERDRIHHSSADYNVAVAKMPTQSHAAHRTASERR